MAKPGQDSGEAATVELVGSADYRRHRHEREDHRH